ncbi:hypothetical protein [Lentzea sp. E54]|uniref:hypothetical protein n=1 Tax=Lentzea xerophila TaxID=3435883 RepID=UPI003DA51F73
MTMTSQPVRAAAIVINLGRVVAVTLSVGTFGFLFVSDAWRAGNLFLVPDLVLCTLLVAAASVRGRLVVPALIFALGLAAGVLITSVSAYAVDGRLGVASLAGALGAVVVAVALARVRS